VQVVNRVLSRWSRRPAHRAARPTSKPTVLSVLAIFSVAGFVAVPLAGPSSMMASAAWLGPGHMDTATLLVSGSSDDLAREDFSVTAGYRMAPAAGRPDPGTSQAIALEMVQAKGWDQGEFSCLVALWSKESGWNHFAMNRSSGAYGIPQSLPGEKMASAGADWATNPATQIRWGLGYIEGRYGSPCAAWGHSQQKNWY
jgi:hypothetical protein